MMHHNFAVYDYAQVKFPMQLYYTKIKHNLIMYVVIASCKCNNCSILDAINILDLVFYLILVSDGFRGLGATSPSLHLQGIQKTLCTDIKSTILAIFTFTKYNKFIPSEGLHPPCPNFNYSCILALHLNF